VTNISAASDSIWGAWYSFFYRVPRREETPLEKQWKATVCNSKTGLILTLRDKFLRSCSLSATAFAARGRSYFKLLEAVEQLSSLLHARACWRLRSHTVERWARDPPDPPQATKPVVFRLVSLVFEDSASSVEVFWPSAAGAGSRGRSRKVDNGTGRKEVIYFPLK